MSSDRSEDDALPRPWVDAWQAHPAQPWRVHRAYQRFVTSQSVRGAVRSGPTALHAARWVLLGVVVGAGSLFAATRAGEWLSPPAPAQPTPASGAGLRAPARPGGPKTSTRTSPAPSAGVAGAVASPAPSANPRASGAPSEPELWQRAARGLRDEDFDSANAALAELMRQGNASERESARLVQAQMLLAQGNRQQAERLLLELASTAHSPRVQQKSRELLSTSRENPSSHRSFSADEGANQP